MRWLSIIVKDVVVVVGVIGAVMVFWCYWQKVNFHSVAHISEKRPSWRIYPKRVRQHLSIIVKDVVVVVVVVAHHGRVKLCFFWCCWCSDVVVVLVLLAKSEFS